jgi:putative transposase
MKLSIVGEIAQSCWLEIPEHFKNAVLDIFQVMPNHLHGILFINQKDSPHKDVTSGSLCRDVQLNKNIPRKGFIHETPSGKGLMNQTPMRNVSPGWPLMKDPRITLGKVVRAFKAKCTKLVRDAGNEDFQWQRNYYDHIIRDGKDLNRIRRYILDNPANWAHDENYPGNVRMDRLHEGEEDRSALDYCSRIIMPSASPGANKCHCAKAQFYTQ